MDDEKRQKDLPERMVVLADADGLEADHAMRTAAEELRKACDAYFQKKPAVSVFKFAGCWARARRVWCDYTGEPLI